MLFISGKKYEKYNINMDWKNLQLLCNVMLYNNIKYI